MVEGGNLVFGYGCFMGCTGLKQISLAEGVVELGEKAFSGCTALETLVLPKTLNKIGYSALYNTSAMRTLAYRGSASEWYKIEFARDWSMGAAKSTPKFNYSE